MNLSNSRLLLSTVFLTALLSACGGSSSSTEGGLLDDPTGTDGSGTGTDTGSDTSGTTTGSDTGSDTSGTDTGSDTGSDTSGTDTGSDTGSDTSGTTTGSDTGSDTSGTTTGSDTGSDTNGTDTGSDTGSDTSGTTTGSDTGSDTSGTDTGSDTGSDTGEDTGGGDTGSDTGSDDGKPSTDDPDMLIPVVEAGSDLERLLNKLHQHVGNTMIDLNQRLSSGAELSAQQEICLGAYDPAFGEQLTAITCETELSSTTSSFLTLDEAAFYDTDDCHASLSAGNSDNCQLQSASIRLKPEWVIPEGERRPVPIYTGALVRYAIKDEMLHMDSDSDALSGYFSCTVDLATGTTDSSETGTSCGGIIAQTADRLDTLLQ